jgi:diguanylate cyclase (GGDEF)-like protein
LLLRRLLQEHAQLLREVTELRLLRDHAYHDPLTGLRNTRYLQIRLNEELQRGGPLGAGAGSLVLLDIDGMGRLNQRHGRAAGDSALRWLSRQLTATVRVSDVCCRTGADRFTLILPDTDRDGAETTVIRIGQAVGAARGESWMPLNFSRGLATWPKDGRDSRELIRSAARSLEDDQRRHRASGARLRLVP